MTDADYHKHSTYEVKDVRVKQACYDFATTLFPTPHASLLTPYFCAGVRPVCLNARNASVKLVKSDT